MLATDKNPSQGRVLIIDDDPMVRDSLDMLFAHYGWDVVAVASGDEALANLPKTQYRLAVVDQLMEGMDGVELVRRLKAHSSAPVFMLTGCVAPDLRSEAVDAGVDRFFSKPVQASTMIEALEEL